MLSLYLYFGVLWLFFFNSFLLFVHRGVDIRIKTWSKVENAALSRSVILEKINFLLLLGLGETLLTSLRFGSTLSWLLTSNRLFTKRAKNRCVIVWTRSNHAKSFTFKFSFYRVILFQNSFFSKKHIFNKWLIRFKLLWNAVWFVFRCTFSLQV